jgi:hypothetical protein
MAGADRRHPAVGWQNPGEAPRLAGWQEDSEWANSYSKIYHNLHLAYKELFALFIASSPASSSPPRSRPLQDIHRRANIPFPSPCNSPCPPNQVQPPGTKTTCRARFHSLFPIPIPIPDLDTYTYPRRDATPGRCRYRVCTRCRTTRRRDNSPLRACREGSAEHHRRARPEEGESTGRR